MTKPVINIADVPLCDGGNGEGFKAQVGLFGAGSTGRIPKVAAACAMSAAPRTA